METNPLVSVIVPMYKVEEYLRKCLDNLINQTYQNLEIILVNDGSPDNSFQIANEYAQRDSRIVVIDKENGGLSDARNAGIDIARGEYIGFIDPDDWMALDFYEYLVGGAKRYGADVVVCEYYNVWETKAESKHRTEDRLFYGRDAVTALLQLKVGNYAWNKLYKRSLWESGIRYPVGKKYEDVRTTYRLFELADLVVALPEPKYFYLRRDSGISGARTVDGMGQCVESRMRRYEVVVDEYPEAKGFLLREINRYTGQFRVAVANSPASDFYKQRELVEYICSFLKTHQKEIADEYGWGSTRRKMFALATEPKRSKWVALHRSYELFKVARKLKEDRRVKKLRGKRADRRKNATLKNYYEDYLSLPIEANLAFVESRAGEDLAGNMLSVAEHLVEKGLKVVICAKKGSAKKVKSIIESSDRLEGVSVVQKFGEDYYKSLATAKYLFNDMVFHDRFVKRSEQVYVNTWHGTPLKCLEFDTPAVAHIMGGASRDRLQTDALAVSCDYLAEKLLSSSNTDALYRGSILKCGYPRNEVFFDEELRGELRKRYDLEEKEVFVYMPTWRGTMTSHQGTGNEYETQKVLDFFEENLNDNQILYAKLHNFAVGSLSFDEYSKVKPFPSDVDTYRMLAATDCLVTDYSSVFFDYANSRKKIILFAFDKEEYLASRGMYIDFDELPFPCVRNYEELKQELHTRVEYDDGAFISRFCAYDNAEAGKLLVESVLAGNLGDHYSRPALLEKKNVLIYDAQNHQRDAFAGDAEVMLDNLDASEANYFYGIRQWALSSTPKYLDNLPSGVKLYPLAKEPFLTASQKKELEAGRCPENVSKCEFARQFGFDAFDEIYEFDSNGLDPFVALLRHHPNYCGVWMNVEDDSEF